ncbi:hypothetical protein O181_044222 [Austropuccinia psidii MF-1]|uniref:Chromo domain-containing protein n=1 Tax=Austropuccinia psidii MF-1 TaxID=1389203 RepID=A0A9Q3HHJ8_9BASI|nr:hypothetical protein [Austropuccinia psidii MF-1]
MLSKARYHANIYMQDSLKYAKERLEKSHAPPHFKLGGFFLVSNLTLNKIKVPKKPFMIRELYGPNAVKLQLTGEFMNKNPTFPASLMKAYSSSNKELVPLRNKPPLEIPPLEDEGEKKIVKVLKERRTRNKKMGYLVRYRNPTQEDEWILDKDINNADKLLRRFRN